LAALRQFADLRSYHREAFPCSPARAASTAAFSASRSVFRRFSSMILIFSATSFIAAPCEPRPRRPSSCLPTTWRRFLSVCLALSRSGERWRSFLPWRTWFPRRPKPVRWRLAKAAAPSNSTARCRRPHWQRPWRCFHGIAEITDHLVDRGDHLAQFVGGSHGRGARQIAPANSLDQFDGACQRASNAADHK